MHAVSPIRIDGPAANAVGPLPTTPTRRGIAMKIIRRFFSTLTILLAMSSVVPLPAIAQTPNTFTVYAQGLQGPRGLRFGPDGFLYVAEAGTGGSYGPKSPGYPKCRQVESDRRHRRFLEGASGEIETVISGLAVPTGMTFGPDGRLYISNVGAVPLGTPLGNSAGQVLRFDIPPGW
jgi:hypothetical protein